MHFCNLFLHCILAHDTRVHNPYLHVYTAVIVEDSDRLDWCQQRYHSSCSPWSYDHEPWIVSFLWETHSHETELNINILIYLDLCCFCDDPQAGVRWNTVEMVCRRVACVYTNRTGIKLLVLYYGIMIQMAQWKSWPNKTCGLCYLNGTYNINHIIRYIQILICSYSHILLYY